MAHSRFNASAWDEIGAALTMGVLLVLSPLLRGWYNRWGATDEETNRALPGDDLLPRHMLRYTYAITIHAPAAEVWPWLVQMGQGRGGLYSYERLENLVDCRMRNADRVLPEFQDLSVGDAAFRLDHRMPPIPVAIIEPEQTLVFYDCSDAKTGEPCASDGPPPETFTGTVMGFYLTSVDEHTTRLIMRGSTGYNASFANTLIWRVFTEPIGFVMSREMLRGIKRRAEQAA
jgi:hypothetical protein